MMHSNNSSGLFQGYESNNFVDQQERYRETASCLAETVDIGRATAEQLHRQGEQLSNAETAAHQTEYLLDKSVRALKGMTWSGWFHNMLSNQVQFKSQSSHQSEEAFDVDTWVKRLCNIQKYLEHTTKFSESRDAVEAVQNYHLHVLLLHEHCTGRKEYISCLEACEKLQLQAQVALKDLRQATIQKHGTLPAPIGETTSFLAQNIALLKTINDHYRRTWLPYKAISQVEQHASKRDRLFDQKSDKALIHTLSIQSSASDNIIFQQERHLESLIPQLDELAKLSSSIHNSLHEQTETVARLDQQSSQLIDKTNHVNRQTHAMIQRKAFRSPTYKIQMVVTIQHIPTLKFISVGNDYQVVLVDTDQQDASSWIVFVDSQTTSNGKWSLIGLQNALTKLYLGMNTSWFSGVKNGVICQATSLRNNEQWEMDILEQPSESEWIARLVCVQANNSNGGYLEAPAVFGEGPTLLRVGGEALQSKDAASLWKVIKMK